MDFCFTQNMIYSKSIAMTAEDISLYHFHSLVLSFSMFVFCLPLTASCVPSTHQRVRVMCGEVSDVRPLFKVLSVASEVCNINQHSLEVLLHPFLSLQQRYQKEMLYLLCSIQHILVVFHVFVLFNNVKCGHFSYGLMFVNNKQILTFFFLLYEGHFKNGNFST